jgi:1-acyl-sn-glycerol-3-phosphate acyltransferase
MAVPAVRGHDLVMAMTNEEAHRIAREEGVSGPFYWTVKVLATLVTKLLCGFTASGKENVPSSGPIVIVPNHKSFWDPFFVAIVLRRPVHFMGKSDYFEGTWYARLFLALGAFPVRRGESDAEALETARAILARGDALALFPEGTRVRDEGLGTPKRGAARLAIEAGAPLIPATITGTEKRRWPLPRRVRIAFGTPVSVEGLAATPEDASTAINAAWPQVSEEYGRWLTRPTTVAAAAAALGVGGFLVRRKLHK